MKPQKWSTGIRVVAGTAAAVLALGAGKAFATAADDAACAHTETNSGGTVRTSDGSGGSGDSHYELWHDGGGSMKMTVYGVHSAFKAEWNNAGDFLARVGLYWGSGQGYASYGNVTADYRFTKSGTGGGYSYIGIYGWSKSPLVEYYIVENGLGNYPPNASALGGATSKGSFEVDGATYDLYTFTRRNAANITGTNQDFPQFWSVRRTARTCGHISVSEHWKKWATVGLTLGNMYEAKLLVEAGGGQGTFDLNYGTMKANVTDEVQARDVAPALSSSGEASWANGKSGTISLVSLNGSVIRSVHQDASSAAVVPTTGLSKGVYLLRFQGEGAAPETRKFLLN